MTTNRILADTLGILGQDAGRSDEVCVQSPDRTRQFEALFKEHHNFVWRSLYRLLAGHASSIDDATQDVFLVVYRRINVLDPDRSARAWLYAICRRVASDYRKRFARASRRHAEGKSMDTLVHPGLEAQRFEDVQFIEIALQQLSLEKREVITLFEMEGLTAKEISEATGTPANTVYARLRTARRELEQVLLKIQARRVVT